MLSEKAKPGQPCADGNPILSTFTPFRNRPQGTGATKWNMAWLLGALLLLSSSLSCHALAEQRITSAYMRSSPSPMLPLDHARLVRTSDSPHQPEQVQLTLAGPGAVAVSWVTNPQDDPDFGQAVAQRLAEGSELVGKKRRKKQHRDEHDCMTYKGLARSVVMYGVQPSNYEFTAEGNLTCYVADDYQSGAIHHVVLGAASGGPLAPDTEYFYSCGDPSLGMSEEFSFRTPPPVGPGSFPYRLGLIGDLGQTENSAETLDHLTASDPGSVINVGDLSYADGYQPRWDSWGRLIAPHTSRYAWANIEGNHEIEVTNGETGFLAYETRFWFPSEQSLSHSPFYYSYEVAGAHVLMLGCYVDYGTDSEQYAWLQRDLATVDRARTPWVIVGMHAPWYNSNTAHAGEMDDMLAGMEDALYQHGVDAVFAGHVHAYERSFRTLRGARDETGPVYIVIGDGGNREGLSETYNDPQPEWSAFREASYGHGVLDLMNATHARWRWHRNQDAVPVVSDEVWLVRNANREVLRQQEVSSLSSWLLQLWTVVAPAFSWFRAVGM